MVYEFIIVLILALLIFYWIWNVITKLKNDLEAEKKEIEQELLEEFKAKIKTKTGG